MLGEKEGWKTKKKQSKQTALSEKKYNTPIYIYIYSGMFLLHPLCSGFLSFDLLDNLSEFELGGTLGTFPTLDPTEDIDRCSQILCLSFVVTLFSQKCLPGKKSGNRGGGGF